MKPVKPLLMNDAKNPTAALFEVGKLTPQSGASFPFVVLYAPDRGIVGDVATLPAVTKQGDWVPYTPQEWDQEARDAVTAWKEKHWARMLVMASRIRGAVVHV